MSTTHGLLLAAGAGRRMGMPKALKQDPDGTSWLERSARVLLDGGCGAVTVVLGASGDRAAIEIPGVRYVDCRDWEQGIGASLAHGLRELVPTEADAAMVHLVDLPDVDSFVVQRLLTPGPGRSSLRRAGYDGIVGHPAVIGRDHWAPLTAELSGDRGAGPYLRRHGAELVECGDLATGRDVDFPED